MAQDILLDKAVLEERTELSCRTLRLHFKRLLSDSAEAGLDRIAQEMGYRDYLKRAGIGDGKLAILRAIAHYEESSYVCRSFSSISASRSGTASGKMPSATSIR